MSTGHTCQLRPFSFSETVQIAAHHASLRCANDQSAEHPRQKRRNGAPWMCDGVRRHVDEGQWLRAVEVYGGDACEGQQWDKKKKE
jgi:hypothetical protein